ncbi:transcriptional activator protein FnrL [Jannaschia pagri]|uniref:Transcriptional activator protein FnrL n=1 Tax=Jannaschia pagri TaxID=2829797 RepID=A0ABQ4NJR7_9RHOB|nr:MULTISPECIES: Crp/Fnr family transcriptional regulator [unclassified Jannaschia]GIT90811.1 transcriptional activator protein FnrL [Jannaschia sp. AI_61]GIT94643.1 transcriptional activator protein FnrL [Jannaschia sp. AI_62]
MTVSSLAIASAALATDACDSCPIRHRAVCASCEGEELDRLAEMKTYRSWKAGDVIAMEGDELPFVASLVTGCASLTRTLEDGRTQMVGLLMPSDFLGRPGRRMAAYEVTAATDVTLCMFKRGAFEVMLADTPNVSRRLLEMSLDELDAAREWMVLLGRKTAREKVATLLAIILRRASNDAAPLRAQLPLTRDAMASYLGLTIETVSRQMTALRKAGVIELDGTRGIACHDLAALLTEAGDDEDGTFLS